MKKLSILAFVFVIALFSCKKDDGDMADGNSNNETKNPPTENVKFDEFKGAIFAADVLVEVKDNQNNLLENITITIGNTVANTNNLGIVSFDDISVSENFLYVKAKGSGYVNGSKTITPQKNTINLITIKLLPLGVVKTIKTGEASTVTLQDGTELKLNNNFFDENGNAVTGDLDVCIHHLSPDDESTFETMPGSLLAEQESGNIRTLETYGMVAVDILDKSGNHVNIDENNPATITFPIANSQSGVAPNEIPLWYFDEEKGVWVEEGKATLQGNKYVGTVNHFSWWNCDVPLEYIQLETSITEQTNDGSVGKPVVDIYVEIIRESTGQKIYQGCSSSDGVLKGNIPFNEEIRVKIRPKNGDCGDDYIYDEIVGPFINEKSVLDLKIDLSNTGFKKFTIKGKINNCKGGSVNKGLIIINSPTSSFKHFTDPVNEGAFEFEYATCELEDISIIGYDLSRDKQILPIEKTLTDAVTTLDLGDLESCEDIVDDIIYEGSISINNQQELNEFTNEGYTKVNGSLSIRAVTDLSALDLKTIEGHLTIGSSPDLNNLTGVEDLVSVNNLNIFSCSKLTKVDEFTNLEKADKIEIRNLDNVTAITGFNKLSDCEAVEIKSSEKLTTVSGFETLISLGTLTISSQEGLQNIIAFQNLEQITSLVITRTGLTNVDFLSNLKTWGATDASQSGSINFYLNRELTNISGLSNLVLSSSTLTSLSLRINSNYKLTSLNGLGTFSHENGSVAILSNSLLTSFDTFKISRANSLEITDNAILSDFDNIDINGVLNFVSIKENTNLTSIKGLSNVTQIRYLYIEENNALTNLQGLENLEKTDLISLEDNGALLNTEALFKVSTGIGTNTIPGSINIINNASLTSINLLGVTELSGTLAIRANNNLTDITKLSNLTKVRNLYLTGNANLVSLQGFNSLVSAHQFDCILNNSIQSLQGMNNLKSLNTLKIEENPSLTNINALSNLSQGSNQANINSITISENPSLTNLNGLSGIVAVEQDFDIINNSSLTSLAGLEQLETVKDEFYITDNGTMTNLNGLSSLSAAKTVYIARNSSMTNLNGVNNLTEADYIRILDNNSLQNIDALSAVNKRFGAVSEELQGIRIENNSQLSNLNGLGGVAKVYNLEISENTGMTNLQGLTNLTEVGQLEITSQGINFTSLEGLNNVGVISRSITIQQNSNLTNFCALQGVSYNGSDTNLRVSNNAYNPDIKNLTSVNCSE